MYKTVLTILRYGLSPRHVWQRMGNSWNTKQSWWKNVWCQL